MKKIALLFLVVGMLFACTKENDVPRVKPAQAAVSNPEPTPTPLPNPAPTRPKAYDRIAQMEEYALSEDGEKRKIYEIAFRYDDRGRLMSFVERYSHSAAETVLEGALTYTGTAIAMTHNRNKAQANLVKPSEYRLTLDEQGLVSKFVTTHYFTTGTDERVEEDFVYAYDGRQIAYRSPFYSSVSVKWNGALPDKIVYKREYTRTEIRTYSSTTNRTYPDLNYFLADLSASPKWKFLWSDEFGLRSPRLLSGRVSVTTESAKREQVRYAYRMDARQRPTEVDIQDSDGAAYRLVITYVEK